MLWLTWCPCPLHHETTYPWWPSCRSLPQTRPCDGLTLLGLDYESSSWAGPRARSCSQCSGCRLRALLPVCPQDMPILSSPATPGQAHRNVVVRPGIKPLPEGHPVSPAPALITRLHFCCFIRYTRFLLFWSFQWDILQFPVDFGHGKQTRPLFVSFRCMCTLSYTNSCSLFFERNQNSEA